LAYISKERSGVFLLIRPHEASGKNNPQWWQFSYLLENYHCYLYQI
jgi:hypothetical protein